MSCFFTGGTTSLVKIWSWTVCCCCAASRSVTWTPLLLPLLENRVKFYVKSHVEHGQRQKVNWLTWSDLSLAATLLVHWPQTPWKVPVLEVGSGRFLIHSCVLSRTSFDSWLSFSDISEDSKKLASASAAAASFSLAKSCSSASSSDLMRSVFVWSTLLFSVSSVILSQFYQSFIESLLSFSFICWFISLSVHDKNSLSSIVNLCSKIIGEKQRDLASFCDQQTIWKAAKHS